MPAELSIVLVNYRSAALILNCIASVKAQTSEISYEIIVVDNLSRDNSQNIICSRYPEVIWEQMTYNAGFARANNRGILRSAGKAVLLLNPDTIVIEKAVERCFLRFMASDFIACGVQLLNADNTSQISGNYFMKGGLNHLLPLPYLGPFLRKIAFAIKVDKPSVVQAASEQRVDWVNGAFLMVKKSAIEKVGLMDEDFFLYAEETEWCSRLSKAGQIVIYGDINVIHLQGESINKETKTTDKGYTNLFDNKGLQLMTSNSLRVRKQFGIAWFFVHILMFTIEIPVFAFGSFLDHILRGKNPFRERKKISGFTKNVFKIWQTIPKVISGKPYFYKMF